MPATAARTTIMSRPAATRRRILSRADLRSARTVEANGSTAASGSHSAMPSRQQSVLGSSRLVCQDSNQLLREWSTWLVALAANVPNRGCRIHGHLKRLWRACYPRFASATRRFPRDRRIVRDCCQRRSDIENNDNQFTAHPKNNQGEDRPQYRSSSGSQIESGPQCPPCPRFRKLLVQRLSFLLLAALTSSWNTHHAN